MIRSINEWKKFKLNELTKEALSVDRERAAQLKVLVEEAKAMLEAKAKMKEITDLKKSKNEEVKQALEELNETSIIAQNVLFEVIKPYERNQLSSKEYIDFVENSVDEITNEYLDIHETAIKLSYKDKKGYSYFRTAQNKKNLEPGTIVEQNVFKRFGNWIKNIINKLRNKISNFRNTLDNISNRAKQFNTVYENIYAGRKSKYKNRIIDIFKSGEELSYDQLMEKINIKSGSSEDTALYRNVKQLLNQNILDRTKKPGEGKRYFYFISETVNLDEINYEEDEMIEIKPDVDPIVAVLEKAKEAIELAEQENYYKQLIKSKEENIMKMMAKFNATKISIGDKILSLVTVSDKKIVDWNEYQNIMLNGVTVSDNVKTMSETLFNTYNKVIQVSGSIRQFDNDSDLPEGTTGATFDYVLKKVIGPKNKETVNENILGWFKKIGQTIMNWFKTFFNAFKNIENALNNI